LVINIVLFDHPGSMTRPKKFGVPSKTGLVIFAIHWGLFKA